MSGAVIAKTMDRVLPGLFAWALTVGWPVMRRSDLPLATALALGAAGALVAGALVSIRKPGLGRMLGVWAFLALCVGVWGSARLFAEAKVIDPVQAAVGALGWAFFGLGWAAEGPVAPERSDAAQRRLGSMPDDFGRAVAGASSRSRLGRGAPWFMAFALAAAAAFLALAIGVPGRMRALFAHAAAVSGAVGLVVAGAELSARPFSESTQAARAQGQALAGRRPRAWLGNTALLLLLALALLGAAFAWRR